MGYSLWGHKESHKTEWLTLPCSIMQTLKLVHTGWVALENTLSSVPLAEMIPRSLKGDWRRPGCWSGLNRHRSGAVQRSWRWWRGCLWDLCIRTACCVPLNSNHQESVNRKGIFCLIRRSRGWQTTSGWLDSIFLKVLDSKLVPVDWPELSVLSSTRRLKEGQALWT